MKTIVNILLILGFLACMVSAVMFFEWTGLTFGGIFAIPAAWIIWTLMERNDKLPRWIK